MLIIVLPVIARNLPFRSWPSRLENIDRRIIFLFVAISLAIPVILDLKLRPASMETGSFFFETVEKLSTGDGKIVLISMDWGPGTSAENQPQTMVAMEHLMRRRIPFAVISTYNLAPPFLKEIPLEVAKRLNKEFPGERWEYGKDWVNLGFRPNAVIMVQALAKSENIKEKLHTDANGTPLDDIPVMQKVKTIKDISMLMEFTGLVGMLDLWLQFFGTDEYRPPFVHGCTSISIPEAFIFYSSKQIVGLFEGIAGAAWYETLLSEKFLTRSPETVAIKANTGVSYAQIIVMGFIVFGNIGVIGNLGRRINRKGVRK